MPKRNNARVMAYNAGVDGARLLFHQWEHDRFQQLYHRLFDQVQAATGYDTAQMRKVFQVKVVRHETSTKGSLRAIQLWGAAARQLHMMPWSLTAHLTEMHVKCYGVQASPDAYEWLVDAAYHAIQHSNVQLSFFGNKATKKSNPKGDGKGVRLGSKKSDKHSVVYKRRGERPGIEVRISDRTMRRCVQEVEDYAAALPGGASDVSKWQLLRAKVGVVGYTYMLDTLRGMGVCFTDYIEGIGHEPSPEDPHIEWLDKAEENAYRATE